MIRQFPVIPTIIVLAAAATMVVLGFWQLGRMDEKAALIARYASAVQSDTQVAWPRREKDYEEALYSPSSVICVRVLGLGAISGTSERGGKGWAHVAHCALPDGSEADVALGYSRDPNPGEWAGGEVSGVIAPARSSIKLVAVPPQAGLEQLARPDPNNMPNNHLAYAGQWFLFALTALGIYWLAVRKRVARPAREG